MLARLLKGIGVLAVIALVAGSLIALTVVSRRIHVTVQDEQEGAARGPDPVELLRADVSQLSVDLGALTDGVGGQLAALHDALEDGARERASAQTAVVAALQQQVQELQARLDRAVLEDAAARARFDQALGNIGARLDAVAAAGPIEAPPVDAAGEVRYVVGSPGGATIITTVVQVLLNRLDLGMTLPEAVAAPRASQRNAASTQAEDAFIAAWGDELTAYGHTLIPVQGTNPSPLAEEIGAVAAIEVGADGLLTAVAEPVRRGGGTALVVQPAG